MPIIEIVPSRQSWADDFAMIRCSVMRAAPDGAYVHHIGSTAVPGLPGKDVIDLQLTVRDLAKIVDSAFEREGFRCVPGLVFDHCPPAVELSEAELRKRLYCSTGRPANLHVREMGRFNQRFALICRDFLRAHPTAAGAYALIKQRLARRFPHDVAAYYEIKDPVFDLIVEGANVWASATGWTEPPGD